MSPETPQEPGQPEYSYESTRDQALHRLTLDGWCEQSSGSTEAPTGRFAYMSNSEVELDELMDVLATDDNAPEIEPDALIGHFLIIEDADHVVQVKSYMHRIRMLEAWHYRMVEFMKWSGDQS